MKVLIFIDHFSPGFRAGGQIRVIENSLTQDSSGYERKVITLDRDLGESEPYAHLIRDQWIRRGHAQVMYLSPARRSVSHLVDLVRNEKPDVLHLNSVFSNKFTLPLLIARRLRLLPSNLRIILSPHGEMAAPALRIKAFKKSSFLRLANWLGLYQDIAWHATSPHEVNDIRAQAIATNANIHLLAPPLKKISTATLVSHAKRPGELKLLFLSRISEMKNLEFLIETLQTYADPIELDIYGPIEPGDQTYWQGCEAKISKLPAHVKVNYKGVVKGTEVDSVLSTYDLFVSPTLGENFGFAILESLACGCPVLISDRTPWAELPRGAGQVLSLEHPATWREAIQDFQKMDSETWRASSLAAKAFADELATKQKRFAGLYDAADLIARNR